jgi:tetratricopeptide (TPR) repeat protein
MPGIYYDIALLACALSLAFSVASAQSSPTGDDMGKLLERAQTEMDRGRLKSAVPYLDKAIELAPDSKDTYLMRAHCHKWLAQLDKAQDDLGAVIRLDPEYAEAYYLRAGIRPRNEGLLIIQDYDAAILHSPNDNADYYLERGFAKRDILLEFIREEFKMTGIDLNFEMLEEYVPYTLDAATDLRKAKTLRPELASKLNNDIRIISHYLGE